MGMLSRQKRKKMEQKGYDFNFIQEVQPKGNIDFTESDWYWKSGDGHHSCLSVTKFPQNGLGYFWGREITQIPNGRSFMHVINIKGSDMQEKIGKAVSEKSSRIGKSRTANQDQAEIDEIDDLMELERDLRVNNANMKGIWVRNYVSESTSEKLGERIDEVKNIIPRFDLSLFLSEQELEYHAPFVPPSRLKDMPNAKLPQPISIGTLAAGFWNDHKKIEDPHGVYFGVTPTGGVVNFDLLYQDSIRTRPYMLISGAQKMGQKKFLVKNCDVLYSKGHNVYYIDFDGTYSRTSSSGIERISEKQHALNVDMSGGSASSVRVNIMEVLPTVVQTNGVDVDQIISFEDHTEALTSIAKAASPNLTLDDLDILKKLIKDFYIRSGLWFDKPEDRLEELHITEIVHNEYPLLSNFVNWLNRMKGSKKYEEISVSRIYNCFQGLKDKYPFLEGYTNIDFLDKEQIICFDLSKLREGSPNLLNIQTIQTLRLIQMLIVGSGKKQRILMEEHNRFNQPKPIDSYKHSLLAIAGAEAILDQQNEQTVQYLSDVVGKIGPNFGAFIMELTNLQNVLLANNQGHDAYSNAIRKLFQTIQYRVFANTDESTVHSIERTYQGSLTATELSNLPRLQQHNFFMNIAGSENVVFTQLFLDDEFERYDYLDYM